MLLKNFVGVIYQSLRKVCDTSGRCTSTRTCFVLNGSRCLIELTRCGCKSNQPSSVAWPLCQPTHCGCKTNEPSSVAWRPLCQPTGCGRSNAAWWPLRCGLKRNELSRGARWPLSQLRKGILKVLNQKNIEKRYSCLLDKVFQRVHLSLI